MGLPENLMDEDSQKMMLMMLFPAILEQHFGHRMGFSELSMHEFQVIYDSFFKIFKENNARMRDKFY